MYNKNYISVGIDVGSAFSFMTIVAPDGSVIQKPFKITHNKTDSLERAVSAIKKAEELYSSESRIFLESTGIYHFPLFCYLVDCGFHFSIINPIITHSSKNVNIRKVKNDKIDSIGIAKLGLSDDIPVSQFPAKLVLELRSLTRKYYDLTDERSALFKCSYEYLFNEVPLPLERHKYITDKSLLSKFNTTTIDNLEQLLTDTEYANFNTHMFNAFLTNPVALQGIMEITFRFMYQLNQIYANSSLRQGEKELQASHLWYSLNQHIDTYLRDTLMPNLESGFRKYETKNEERRLEAEKRDKEEEKG